VGALGRPPDVVTLGAVDGVGRRTGDEDGSKEGLPALCDNDGNNDNWLGAPVDLVGVRVGNRDDSDDVGTEVTPLFWMVGEYEGAFVGCTVGLALSFKFVGVRVGALVCSRSGIEGSAVG